MNAFGVYPAMTLAHLQRRFTEPFPYLRIEPAAGRPAPGKRPDDETLSELSGHASHWCFLVEGDMDVAERKDNLRRCFGLTVRVNRWTGRTWHSTDDTPHWPLAEQNREAAGLCTGWTLVASEESQPKN